MIDDDHLDTFNEQYKIKTVRNEQWNYSSAWWYLVTICTVHHNKFFGKIVNGQMNFSQMGLIAKKCIGEISQHFSNVYVDDFVVMPNHVHILMKLKYQGKQIHNQNTHNCRDVACIPAVVGNVSTKNDQLAKTKLSREFFAGIAPKKNTLSVVIRSYKSAVTQLVNPQTTFFGWQERYHEEIIKDAKHFQSAKYYIKNNVKNWQKDKENI